MSVSSVGTPANVHSATGSVTAAWGTGQSRTAGNLLAAVVTAGATTSAAAVSTPSGWAKRIDLGNSATAHTRAAVYTRTAAGADAAPAFTSTETGTAGGMDVMLFEFTGADTGTVLDVIGMFASGGSTATLNSSTFKVNTFAPASAAGAYAIAVFSQERTAASLTFTDAGTGWTKLLNGNGASAANQTAVLVQASPSTSAVLNDHGAFSTTTSAFGVALIVVVRPAVTGTQAVTATQGGSTGTGMLLRVLAFTAAQAAAAQAAGTGQGSQSGAAAHDVALATTVAGSVVWSVFENADHGTGSPNNNPAAGNTSQDDLSDAVNNQQYGTAFSAATVTPGAFTAGSLDSFGGGAAALEILPAVAGTPPAVDASSPGAAFTVTATAVTTAGFTPPAGGLLVALVSANGGASATTMTLTDVLGLTWTEVVKGSTAGNKYAGIWVADVPAAGTPATAAGSLAISGTAAGAAAATAAGALAVTGAAAARASAQAAGTLAVTGTAAAAAPAAATGTLAVTGTAAGAAAAAAAGTLAITGTATAGQPGTTGTGALAITGTAGAAAPATAAGSLTVTGAAAAAGSATAAGAFTVTGTAAARAAATSAGTLAVTGVASTGTPATAAGQVTVTGTGPPGAAASSTGTLTITGAAAARAVAAAAGQLTVTGQALAAGRADPQGSLTVTGTAMVQLTSASLPGLAALAPRVTWAAAQPGATLAARAPAAAWAARQPGGRYDAVTPAARWAAGYPHP